MRLKEHPRRRKDNAPLLVSVIAAPHEADDARIISALLDANGYGKNRVDTAPPLVPNEKLYQVTYAIPATRADVKELKAEYWTARAKIQGRRADYGHMNAHKRFELSRNCPKKPPEEPPDYIG